MQHDKLTIDELVLESGLPLRQFDLAWATAGRLNAQRDNVIWVCHALTANADVAAWWPGMVGPGLPLDTDQYHIICVNIPGSCYGSVGPLSVSAHSGRPFFHRFPELTARDVVACFDRVRQHLQIPSIQLLIGASLGGQHALQWAVSQPQLFRGLVLLATNAAHSPWGMAWNEAQRMAIAADATWWLELEEAGLEGMKAARAMALLSYRHALAYNQTQPRQPHGVQPAVTYQRYQGQKLAQRFNAFSYWYLSKLMDSHDVSQGHGSLPKALARVEAPTLVISISSDILFPVEEQAFIARHVSDGRHVVIDSDYGHDGFLVETEAIGTLISEALQATQPPLVTVKLH